MMNSDTEDLSCAGRIRYRMYACTFVLTALAVEVMAVLIGVWAFVPERMWEERNVTAGVLLIVFSGFISLFVGLVVFLFLMLVEYVIEISTPSRMSILLCC